MTIWRVEHNLSEYDYLALDNEVDAEHLLLDGSTKLSSWNPLYIQYWINHDKPQPNFPRLSGLIVCDAKAREKICDLIDDYAEFLPLASNTIINKQYFVINTTTILDCLDFDKSEFARLKTGTIRGIVKYVMKPECIKSTPIFKLPLLKQSYPYVTDQFKQIVEENNLTGLVFNKVWEEK